MRFSIHARRRQRRAVAALAFASVAWVPSTTLADKSWNTSVPNGSWNTAASWVPAGIPASTDNHYQADGDGQFNDVALTVIPAPAGGAPICLAFALLFRRRRSLGSRAFSMRRG